MAISKTKKGEIVDKLSQVIKEAKSLVFVNFHGLKVSDSTAMRQALKGEGVSYGVAKKTLARRALDLKQFEGTRPELEGELALAWGLPAQTVEDLIAPARGIQTFVKKFPLGLKILGGIFEGRYLNALEMTEIASIPTLEVLRGKFVNIINSPIQRMALVLNEISKKQ